MAKTSAKHSGKANSLALHVDLNGVSATAYGGWAGPLSACESTPTTWPRLPEAGERSRRSF